ncbi:MAG: SBBP repeat-containing protein [Limisphaerales bacterium]
MSPVPLKGLPSSAPNVLSSNGGYAFDDMYLVKYDPAGNVLWARRAGGSGKDYGTAITLDGAGGIYVAGTSDSYPATFGTNVLYMFTQSAFIAHYDGNGNVLWVGRGGSTGFPGGTVSVNGIARDAVNNVIVAGSFKGSPNFGGNFNGQTGSQTIYLTNHNTVVPRVRKTHISQNSMRVAACFGPSTQAARMMIMPTRWQWIAQGPFTPAAASTIRTSSAARLTPTALRECSSPNSPAPAVWFGVPI